MRKPDEREENLSLEWHLLLLWFGKERPGHSWKGRVKAVLVGAHATAHSKELAATTSNAIVQHRVNIVDYQKGELNSLP
jgi:hypothetical protein